MGRQCPAWVMICKWWHIIQRHVAKYSEMDLDFVEKLKNRFFVNDLASGAKTVDGAFELYLKMKGRMAEGKVLPSKLDWF